MVGLLVGRSEWSSSMPGCRRDLDRAHPGPNKGCPSNRKRRTGPQGTVRRRKETRGTYSSCRSNTSFAPTISTTIEMAQPIGVSIEAGSPLATCKAQVPIDVGDSSATMGSSPPLGTCKAPGPDGGRNPPGEGGGTPADDLWQEHPREGDAGDTHGRLHAGAKGDGQGDVERGKSHEQSEERPDDPEIRHAAVDDGREGDRHDHRQQQGRRDEDSEGDDVFRCDHARR